MWKESPISSLLRSAHVMVGEAALRTDHRSDVLLTHAAVIGCALNHHQRAHVIDGLRRTALRFVDTFGELERILTAPVNCDALILVPEDRTGRTALPTVERVAREWPGIALVMLCSSRAATGTSLRHLVIAGAHQLVFEGMHDTAAIIAAAVEHARAEGAADLVFRDMALLVPPALHSIVMAVLGRPDVLTTVQELSIFLGVHRRTLLNRCTKERFLQPAELITWCRLAVVSHFLERTGATVESLALKFGFPSHTALRNLIKRYTGMRATEIRSHGGLALTLAAMRARVGPHAGQFPAV